MSTIQCYKCRETTIENASFSIQRFSLEEKGKAHVHLIKPMNERQEKALMGLKRNLKIPQDVIDFMAQTK